MSSGPSTIDHPATARDRRLASVSLEGRYTVRMRRDELTGYVMSFILHLAVMIALTITVVVTVQPGSPVPITVTTELPEEKPLEYFPVEFAIEPSSGENAPAIISSVIAGLPNDESPVLPSVTTALTPGGTDGEGTGQGPRQPSGTWVELPKNAVQAGSFAAWWIPKVERYGEKVEAGQLPREGQDYRIYVQVLVPQERKTYKVDDLSGEIVGTDGYKQLIPDRAWTMDEKGNLVQAVGSRRYLKVQNGVAEIVFKVDGAGKAGVSDTIRIRSRLLDEEQTMTLVFQPLSTTSE